MDVTYRPAEEKDIESLKGLLRELGYESTSESIRQRLASIRAEGGEVFVAEVKGSVVGCVHALIDIRLAEGQSGEVVSLVTRAYQGKGIGTQLINRARSWAASKGYSSLPVRADVRREEAHRFYESRGFKEIKTQKVFAQTIEQH